MLLIMNLLHYTRFGENDCEFLNLILADLISLKLNFLVSSRNVANIMY